MKRGTRVGQAYVAITADGSGINKDIVDDIDGAHGDIKDSGDRAGKEYGDSFGDSLGDRLEPIMEKLGDTLSRRLSRRVGDGLKTMASDESSKGLGARLGESIGASLTDRMESHFADFLDTVEAKMGSVSGNGGGGIGGGSTGSTSGNNPQTLYKSYDFATLLEAARVKLHKASNDLIEKDDRDLVKTQQSLYDTIIKAEQNKAAFLGKFENARAKLHDQSNTAIEKDDQALVKVQQRIFDAARKESIKADADMWKVRNATAKAHYTYLSGLAKGSLDEQGNSVSRNRGGESGGLDIGKMFGKGSRNNFLNIIGSSLGGVANMMQGLVGQTKSFVTVFKTGMAEAGDSANIFQRIMGGAGATGSKALTGLMESGPGAAIAIAIATTAASILASVLSALLAIAVALAATIASALVGAAAVGAAGLIALATAGGLVAAAFMSMTNAQKDMLTGAFTPLRSEMVGIGQIMITQMVPYFQIWSDNLQRALTLLAPVAAVAGHAFGMAGAILTDAFTGPGFQAMSTALGVFLPSIIMRLSHALGGFLNGAMGLFAAIMPQVNRFAGYLADVADRFSNWANSAKGQNAIQDFVNRAVESLQSLWNFTKEVFGFIGDLLFSPQAQNAGNSMFDSMTDAFRSFRKAIATAIANGDLQKWFDDARKFGSALWEVIQSLYSVFVALDNSHVLDALTTSLEAFAGALEWGTKAAGYLPGVLTNVLDLLGNGTVVIDQYRSSLAQPFTIGPVLGPPLPTGDFLPFAEQMSTYDAGDLISMGQSAQDHTFDSMGGNIPDPVKKDKQYKNPYEQWAQQFIDQGPSMAQQIKTAVRTVNKQFNKALSDAAKAVGGGEARSLIASSIASAKSVADSMVESAKSALSSAAQSLASAGNAGDAARALAGLKKAQEGLRNALKAQDRIERAMARLGKQKVVTGDFVKRLLEGDKVGRATLADYAAAREKLAKRIEKANQKLADAIALRKDYKAAVVDAVKSFGSILSAQAKTIDGVEQALTFTDITDNLQARLDKIREFSDNLRKLLALGLSNDAYKQLVDGGVEASGAYAAALVAGGSGAVGEVNSLTSQIGAVADSLGTQSANRLYQAGVDAAQGLVDGLESMSDKLDSAATRLGESIANAIKRALGITDGKKHQHNGGGNGGGNGGNGGGGGNSGGGGNDASGKVSTSVAVSPEVAAYAALQARLPVSGNMKDPRFRDLIIQTPTENPKAVAAEVLNEVTGRL